MLSLQLYAHDDDIDNPILIGLGDSEGGIVGDGGERIFQSGLQEAQSYLELWIIFWERSGSVVECLTRDRSAAGSSPTSVTVLCP